MTGRTRWRSYAADLLTLLAGVVLASLLDTVLPYLVAFGLAMLAVFLYIMFIEDGWTPRWAWQTIRHWRALHEPLVWNDDGIRAAILLPGESLHIHRVRCPEHEHVVAHVVRRNGSIRQEAEWNL